MYTFIKYLLRFYLPLFFKRISTEGAENIPENEAIIFAVNHQNTFLDAVIPVYQLHKSAYFLMRSDLFKGRLFKLFFSWLHLLPIYRKQDGERKFREKNLKSFRIYGRKLLKGHPILIFPEGTSQPHHELIPLKKGIARMSVDILQHELKDKKLYIVPVCIQYRDLLKPRKQIWIKYLPAIPIHELIDKKTPESSQTLHLIMRNIKIALRANLLLDSEQKKVSDFFRQSPKLIFDSLEETKGKFELFNPEKIKYTKKNNIKFKDLLLIILFFPTYLLTQTLLLLVKEKAYRLSILCFGYLIFGFIQTLLFAAMMLFYFCERT